MDYGYFHKRHWRDGGYESKPGVGQVVVHDHDGNHDLYDLRGLGAGTFKRFRDWYEATFDGTIWVGKNTRGQHMFFEIDND